MKKNLRLTFQKGDFLAVLLVLAAAFAVGMLFRPGDADAQQSVIQIYQDGRLVKELSPETDCTVEIAGDYINIVEIRDGKVAIVDSDCPGEDCVHSGWISRAGRVIVCLPNKVEVRITGASEVDFVVG